MRSLVLGVLGLAAMGLTSACAAPIGIVVAKLGVDASLLATTHKSSTDHVFSAAADQDCNSFRVLVGKAICREREGGGDPYGVDRNAPHRAVAEDGVHTYTVESTPSTTLNDGVFLAKEATEPTPPAPSAESGEVVAAGELAPPTPAPSEETAAPPAPAARKVAAKVPPQRKHQHVAKTKPPKARAKPPTIEARRPESAPDKG